MNFFKESKGILAVCGVFIVLGILRLNDLSLYTDSTRYLILGTSVAQFKGYVDDTQPDPDRYVVNAPLYPALLLPALIVFPHSIIAAKVWTILWGACALFLFHAWLANSMSRRAATLGTAFLALNPLILVVSSEVLSEAPFLAIMMLMLILLDKLVEHPQPSPALTVMFIASACTVILLREVSVTLLGAVFLTLIIRKRGKLALLLLACTATVFGLWLIRNLVLVGETPAAQSSNIHFFFQHAVTPPDASFLTELTTRMRRNIGGFAVQLGGMLLYPLPANLILWPGEFFKFIANNLTWGKYVVISVVSLFSLIGLVKDFLQSKTGIMRIVFIILYLMVVVTYPIHDVRFLLPLLPIMIYYLIQGVLWLTERSQTELFRKSGWMAATFVLAVIPNIAFDFEIIRTNFSYVQSPKAFFEKSRESNPDKTYFTVPWQLAGEWIREHTAEGVVIASSAKDIAPFVGNRKVMEINIGVPLPLFEIYLRYNAAEYMLCTGLWSDVISYEFFINESSRLRFEHIYSVSNLHVFKVRSRWRTSLVESLEPPGFDTTSASGLLRKGRHDILTENYPDAVQVLRKATFLEPNQPESVFQLFLAYAFMGDSLNAIQQVQSMFTKPRSTPYVWAAQIHLAAMNQYQTVKRLKSEVQQSNLLFSLSKSYWNLGYRNQAYRLIRETVDVDPTFFSGLLWAWHYGIQTGDTARARAYLRTLESIDRTNAVVKSFRAMTQFSDALRRSKNAEERARLRLSIAGEYDKMELSEEAIDEAERAIGEYPPGQNARKFIGDIFRKNNKMRAAANALDFSLHPSEQK